MKKTKKAKIFGIISLILSLCPYVVFIYCLFVSQGSFDESSTGAVWWLLIFYLLPGILIYIISLILGIIGIFIDKNKSAIIAIFLNALVLLSILGLMFTVMFS